jgi:hypothetical protein
VLIGDEGDGGVSDERLFEWLVNELNSSSASSDKFFSTSIIILLFEVEFVVALLPENKSKLFLFIIEMQSKSELLELLLLVLHNLHLGIVLVAGADSSQFASSDEAADEEPLPRLDDRLKVER